jgi:hypothetical protein
LWTDALKSNDVNVIKEVLDFNTEAQVLELFDKNPTDAFEIAQNLSRFQSLIGEVFSDEFYLASLKYLEKATGPGLRFMSNLGHGVLAFLKKKKAVKFLFPYLPNNKLAVLCLKKMHFNNDNNLECILTDATVDKIQKGIIWSRHIPHKNVDNFRVLNALSHRVFENTELFKACKRLNKTLVYVRTYWKRFPNVEMPSSYRTIFNNRAQKHDVTISCVDGEAYGHHIILEAAGYGELIRWESLTVKQANLGLEFIYTRKLHMSKDTTYQLLKVASCFNDKAALDYCKNYITHCVEVANQYTFPHDVWWALDMCLLFDLDENNYVNWLRCMAMNYLYQLPEIQDYKRFAPLFETKTLAS